MNRRHLSTEQTATLAQVLRDRQRQLKAQQSGHQQGRSRAEHARDVLLQDGDDAPQRDADREVDLALSDMEAVELAAIDQALQRIETGHYGLCSDCGAGIAFARLELEPQAQRCIDCERRHEQARERGQHHPSM